MTTGDGIFLGLIAIAMSMIVCTLVVCTMWRNIQERARSNGALTPTPRAAQSRPARRAR